MISLLQKARQPFNANSIAQAAAIGALEDESWVRQCRRRNFEGLKQMEAGFDKLGLQFIQSAGNFILLDVGNGQSVFEALQKEGVISRPMPRDLSKYIRLSIGTEMENEKALSALSRIMPNFKAS